MIRIGTSGWVYKHWKGVFYPPELPERSWLEFFCRQFDTVEINNSFYRLPLESTFAAWRKQTPEGFCFAVKASRFITHIKRLKDPADPIERFFSRVQALGPRTGPILWQLPPSMKRDDDRLAAFLAALPRAYRHAFEFRHKSWLDAAVYGLLAEYDAALCIPDRPDLPCAVERPASWSYVRLHGSAENGGRYDAAELDRWAERIRRLRADDAAVYVYFNNDQRGFAIDNARALRDKLT